MDFVSNRADQATGTVRTRALIDNDRMLFLPGVFGHVQLLGSAPYKAVMLPDEAVGTDQSQRFVHVLNGENVPEQKRVELGRLIDGVRVVRSGVGAEDKVVVGGLQRAPRPARHAAGAADRGAAHDPANGRATGRAAGERHAMNPGRFFIDRPIFAIVLSLVILVVGGIAASPTPPSSRTS